MLWRFYLASVVVFLAALPAPGQAVAQPNKPADATAADTPFASGADDQRLTQLARQFAAKPATQPAGADAAKPAAAPLSANEKLSLGHATNPAKPTFDAGAGASNSSWLLSTLTALGLVVGLILLFRAGIAKMTGRAIATSQSPVVEVLSRTSVAPKNHVLLLRLGQRILVVGDSGAGMTTLADIADPEEVAGLLQAVAASKPGSSTAGFSQLLHGFDGEYDKDAPRAELGTDVAEHHVDRARDRVRGLMARLRNAGKGGGA